MIQTGAIEILNQYNSQRLMNIYKLAPLTIKWEQVFS